MLEFYLLPPVCLSDHNLVGPEHDEEVLGNQSCFVFCFGKEMVREGTTSRDKINAVRHGWRKGVQTPNLLALFFTMMIWTDGRTDRQMEAVHDVHMDFNNCDDVDSARSKMAMITLSSVFVFPIRVPPCPRLS